jgi:hypothetical protein
VATSTHFERCCNPIRVNDIAFVHVVGAARVHFSRFGEPAKGASLWLYTHRMADAAASRDTLVEIRFTQDLYAPFYGGWQFDIEDPNGVSLYFHSP